MRRYGIYLMVCMAVLCAGGYAVAAHDKGEPDDDNRFSVHGEVRFRGEMWENMFDFTDNNEAAFGGAEADDNFDLYPYRYRVLAKGDLGHDVWVGVEFQGTGVAGGGLFGDNTLPFGDGFEIGESGVSIYQGNIKLVDIGDSVLDLTIGRSELVLDTGLHFSALPFYNGISHDGAIAAWQWEKFGLTGFVLRNTEGNLDALGVTCGPTFGSAGLPSGICPDDDHDMWTLGVHGKHFIGGNEHHDVAYYLFVQKQDDAGLDPSVTAGVDSGRVVTLGGRWGKYLEDESGFHWNIEAAMQGGDYQSLATGTLLMPNVWGVNTGFGTFASCDSDGDGTQATTGPDACDAGGIVVEASGGYTWDGDNMAHTVWGGVTYASGDDDPNDSDQDAYMPLYTDFHKRLGYADLWAMSNIQAFYAGYKGMLNDKHLFGGTFYVFQKAEDEGLSYSPLTGAGGVFVDCPPTGGAFPDDCEGDLGSEVDIFYNYYMTNNLSFDTALSYVDPGDAVEAHICGVGGAACTEGEGGDAAWRLTYQARARF